MSVTSYGPNCVEQISLHIHTEVYMLDAATCIVKAITITIIIMKVANCHNCSALQSHSDCKICAHDEINK